MFSKKDKKYEHKPEDKAENIWHLTESIIYEALDKRGTPPSKVKPKIS